MNTPEEPETPDTPDPDTPDLQLGRGAAAAGVGAIFASFRVDPSTNLTPFTTQIGTIQQVTASTVAYNTSSAPRLKERTGDVADAADTPDPDTPDDE